MEPNSHEPWRKAHWHCSPHNFDPSLQVPPHPVALHDITVRDGEECADVAFTVDDKVRIAEALALVGIRRMEVFLTVPGWLEAVRAILRRKLPLDLYVTWHPGRVERVLELGVRHIMVWYRIADEHQRYDLRRSRKELLDQAADQIGAARKAGCKANLFIVEGSRAPLDQLKEAVLIGKQAGAAAVTVVDSYGVARPAAVGFLVRQVREWSGLEVDVHCHNDFGLSTANVLAAYEAGATGLNVAVNGLGYRAGNAPLDEVAMALEVLYGVDTGLRLEMLPWLGRLSKRSRASPSTTLSPSPDRARSASSSGRRRAPWRRRASGRSPSPSNPRSSAAPRASSSASGATWGPSRRN